MTYEYTCDPDERRRIHALEKAIETGADRTDHVLDRARKFESYLRGDEEPAGPKVNITVNERKASW